MAKVKVSRAVQQSVERTSRALAVLVGVIAWVTGVLVALAVGFGMTSGTLSVPGLNPIFAVSAGWIVIVLALVGAFLAILERITR